MRTNHELSSKTIHNDHLFTNTTGETDYYFKKGSDNL